MAFRRTAMFLVIAALALPACGGDDEGDSGVTVEEPIGAPEPEPLEAPPSVAKSARVEMEVARADVPEAAQAVVDLATSDQIGGFLSSSVVDLEEGYGAATILVEVPAARFERAVSLLGDVGRVTRQEMAGEDLSPGTLATVEELRRARGRMAALRARLETVQDPENRNPLVEELARVRAAVYRASQERRELAADAAYAPIDVALAGKRPPPPAEESTIGQALDTARAISARIASGAILGAAVVLPIGSIVFLLWLAWTLVIRRLRVRWEQLG